MSVHILAVDDEPLSLCGLVETISESMPSAQIHQYEKSAEALLFAQSQQVDIAFIDINLGITSGIPLAQDILCLNPKANIIFVTGYSDHKGDAMDMHASGYIVKPVTKDKVLRELSDLRHPIESFSQGSEIFIQTFGDFEIFAQGKPLKFHYAKTKELLAILVDRRGAFCTNNLLISLLWENALSEEKKSYLRNLKMDLIKTLSAYTSTPLILHHRGEVALDMQNIQCDYYELLRGIPEAQNAYHGEYMAQYSWAEQTNGFLYKKFLQ